MNACHPLVIDEVAGVVDGGLESIGGEDDAMSKAWGSTDADDSDSASETEPVTIFLAHREWETVERGYEGEDFSTTTTAQYSLTPVEVRRPVTGFRCTTTMTRCDRCGTELRCVGYGPSRTRWRRRRRYAAGWATIALAVAAWCFTGVKIVQYGSAPIGGVTSFLIILILIGGVGPLAVGIAFIQSDRDDSIRLHTDRLHSRRAAGDTYEVTSHTSPPRAAS